MPSRDPLAYKFTGATNPDGSAAEFIPGLPSRDIHRSEFDGMTDDEKAALHTSPLHRAYGKADEEAEAAAARQGVDDAAPPPADAAVVAPVAPEPAPAPATPERGGRR